MSAKAGTLGRIHTTLSRLLLPRKLYAEHGAQIERAFSDLYTEAWDHGAHRGRGRLLAGELGSIVRTAVDERRRRLRPDPLSLSDQPTTPSPENQLLPAPRSPRKGRMFDNWTQDVRYALRTLRRSPGFAAVAIVTLALGIGANTVIFSLAHGVLWSPLPYPDSNRLVNVFRLAEDVTGMNPPNEWIAGLYSVPHALYLDWRELSPVFEEVGAYAGASYTLTGGDQPENVMAMRVTSGVFATLGIEPALGRVLGAEDDEVGAPAQAILANGFWLRRFGGDRDVLGKNLILNGTPVTVVGVMPAGFGFPDGDEDMWVTFGDESKASDYRPGGNLQVIGRLEPGITVDVAQREMDAIARTLGELYPEESEHGIRVVARQELMVAESKPVIFLFTGALVLVLLVVCANIAGLLLVRALERQQEIAVRSALGAGRGRLVRQVLSESVVLSLLGGTGGCVVAFAALGPFVASFPGGLPGAGEIGLDYRVPLFAAGLALTTGVAMGLLPALRSARTSISSTLRSSARGATGGRRRNRAQAALVVSQVAMAFALLAGAGVVAKSFVRLAADERGFVHEQTVLMRIVLPVAYRDGGNASRGFFRDISERLAALPGVEGVGSVSQAPFRDGLSFPPTNVRTSEEIVSAAVHTSSASPSYHEVMRIPLLSGRYFNDADVDGAAPVILINETMARTFWPDEDALGQQVQLNYTDEQPWRTVVGIVGDVRYRFGDGYFPEFYIPLGQSTDYYQTIVLRTAMTPGSVVTPARDALRAADPDLPPIIRVYDDVIHGSSGLAGPRFGAQAIGSLATIAALLAVLGIYGVLASAVTQRTHEIGIRIALGARTDSVVRAVLGRGLVLAVIGLFVGLGVARLGARLLESVLYETSANDPTTLIGMAVLLVLAASLASYVPARRATRIDPVDALRGE